MGAGKTEAGGSNDLASADRMTPPPVIIVGAARSGTKYLRDTLAASPDAARVPYDVSYVWRMGNEAQPTDVFAPDLARPQVRGFVRSQLIRLANWRPGKVLLEKTVGSTLRVPFCTAIFPEAKFVHLVRDGRAVTESAMRQWEAPPEWGRLFEKLRGLPLRNLGYAAWFVANYATGLVSGRGGGKLWGPRYPGADADLAEGRPLAYICARQWAASVEIATRDLAALPAPRVLTIRYEELMADDSQWHRLAAFCGLSDPDAIVAAHRARALGGQDDKWRQTLTAEQQAQMLAGAGAMLARFGYADDRSAAA